YRVTGVDASEEMLDLAREHAGLADESVTFVPSTYADLPRAVSGGADGLYCLGNALAAAGSRQGVAEAVAAFAASLRPGGRLFIQVLNFEPMRAEGFCVRGPRVSVVDGRELVSVRHFHCARDTAEVTNITLFNEDGWRMRSHRGTLYPLRLDELRGWCAENGLRVDDVWGGYDRQPLDPKTSIDLILVATRE
ncbi:MAG: class I SAM-dependent methyltransferase, partial [Phycisphaerae bacterium]